MCIESKPKGNHGTLNVNVGLLGHVDSGKTSIAKALCTLSSTACFDKHTQSKERGITIDLGFSAWKAPAPPTLLAKGYHTIQYTVVDCPGHADFIRTIIGGGNIIDLMLLVIDAKEGIQVQTSESIVIGEILNRPLIVLLNKADLIAKEESDSNLITVRKKLQNVFKVTRWRSPQIISISCNPESSFFHSGFLKLHECAQTASLPMLTNRIDKSVQHSGFLMYIDHCFNIKGKGTVLTGTVTEGHLELSTSVEIPSFAITRKIKSLQAFHTDVSYAQEGDRVGVLLKDCPASKIERALVCSPGFALENTDTFILRIHKVRFYTRDIVSGEQFHICVGHESSVAKFTFFSGSQANFTLQDEFIFLPKLAPEATALYDATGNPKEEGFYGYSFVKSQSVLRFSHKASVIAFKIDGSVSGNSCRVAFHGEIISTLPDPNCLKIITLKHLDFTVERWYDSSHFICKGPSLMRVQSYIGKDVICTRIDRNDESTYHGKIIDSFGKSGKMKVQIFIPEKGQKLAAKLFKVQLLVKKHKKIW